MSKSKRKNEWVIYPDIQLTIDDYKKYSNMSELEKNEEITLTPESITLPEVTNLPETTIAEEVSEVITEQLEEEKELTEEEKREIKINFLKNSHIKFHPIKNATKSIVTSKTVTALGRVKIEKSKITLTNVTTNQFGGDYRKKRQRKNKMASASRRANRG